MDCGKDFYGDEYVEHTKCISEAEKYQGALFKEVSGGVSKGDQKQQEWLQVSGVHWRYMYCNGLLYCRE